MLTTHFRFLGGGMLGYSILHIPGTPLATLHGQSQAKLGIGLLLCEITYHLLQGIFRSHYFISMDLPQYCAYWATHVFCRLVKRSFWIKRSGGGQIFK